LPYAVGSCDSERQGREDEFEQFGVEVLLELPCQPVRRAGVDFQGGVREQPDCAEGGCLDGHDLVAVGTAIPHANLVRAVQTPGRHDPDTVTATISEHVATSAAAAFLRTCRKRHLGDIGFEKAAP
jgi:hypothetical protein